LAWSARRASIVEEYGKGGVNGFDCVPASPASQGVLIR
jgi:hypothetical protein